MAQELQGQNISKEMMSQMAVKAIDNTVKSNRIVPTLLVFGAYPRMVELNPPTPSAAQRPSIIRESINGIRKFYAKI